MSSTGPTSQVCREQRREHLGAAAGKAVMAYTAALAWVESSIRHNA
jgi:hypothetical protein